MCSSVQFSVVLVMLFQISSIIFANPLGKGNESYYLDESEIKQKGFHLQEDEFLVICSSIALFIMIAVFVIFGLIFYGESQEFKNGKNAMSTQNSPSRTYLPSKNLRSRNYFMKDLELTPTNLETIQELQAETSFDNK